MSYPKPPISSFLPEPMKVLWYYSQYNHLHINLSDDFHQGLSIFIDTPFVVFGQESIIEINVRLKNNIIKLVFLWSELVQPGRNTRQEIGNINLRMINEVEDSFHHQNTGTSR